METGIDLEELRQLISIVERNSIEELTIEEEGVEIVIKAEKPVVQTVPPEGPPPSSPATAVVPHPGQPVPSVSPQLPAHPPAPEFLVPIVAPLVGIFYRAPAPDEPPFVEEGDWVEVGQVVGTIEAMKIFNDIHVEIRGRVVQILVENEQLVTQGEPLMLLDPRPGEEGRHE